MRKYSLSVSLMLAGLLSPYAYATSASSAPESLFVKSYSLSSDLAQYTFSGTPGGGIDYLQSCFATSDACSSCTLPLLFTTYSTSIPYGTYTISMKALSNLLRKTQIGAGDYFIKLAVQSMGFDCAGGTAYCRGTQDADGHNLCLSVTYDGTAVTALIQNDARNVSLTSNPMKQYLYIVDTVQKNSLLSCPLSAEGLASTCALTPSGTATKLGSPQSAAITTIDGTQYMYVAGQGYIDGGGLTPSAITQCTLGTGGSVSGCIQVKNNNYTWIVNPGRMTITTVGNTQYAYTTDVTNSTITKCTLDSTGVFGACLDATSGGNLGGTPLGMAFAVTNNKLYAYVAVSGGLTPGILQCSVGTDGLLSGCLATGGGVLWNPYDIKIAYSSDAIRPTRYAYVADHDNSHLYKCDINNATGELTNCAVTPTSAAPSWQPLQISLGVAESGADTQLYAYVADDSAPSSLWKCAMQTTGELDSCNQMSIAGYTLDSFVGTAIGYTAPSEAFK